MEVSKKHFMILLDKNNNNFINDFKQLHHPLVYRDTMDPSVFDVQLGSLSQQSDSQSVHPVPTNLCWLIMWIQKSH